MRIMTRCALASLLVLAVSPTLARAQVVFDRSDPWTTTVHQTLPGLNINANNGVASQFSFGASTNLGGVRFWASQTTGWSDPGLINWSIYTQPTFGGFPDLDQGPGAALMSGTSTTTRTLVGTDGVYSNYEYNFTFPSLLMPTGVFWLALNVNSAVGAGSLLWDYGQFFNDTHVVYSATAGDYSSSPLLHMTTMRYQLLEGSATVTPEPVTVVLLGFGLAGVGAASRRRRRGPASGASGANG
jgi:hypothetical protein